MERLGLILALICTEEVLALAYMVNGALERLKTPQAEISLFQGHYTSDFSHRVWSSPFKLAHIHKGRNPCKESRMLPMLWLACAKE